MLLVVGATGQLGGAIARRAISAGRGVRILVRPGSDYDSLVKAGAQAIEGDLKDFSSLERACRGVDTVITTANSAKRGAPDTVDTVDRLGNAALIDAAAAAGVQRFIFTSLFGADPRSSNPFVAAKGKSEEHLRSSGMTYTILQPDIFMDVWIDAIVDKPLRSRQPVTLIGGGQARHSFVAERDVATFALSALDNPDARGMTVVVGGPRPVSWNDIIGVYQKFLGYPVTIENVSPGSILPGASPFVSAMVDMMEHYESPIDMTQTARDFNVLLTSVETYVRESIARWA